MAVYDRDFVMIDEDRSKLPLLKGKRVRRLVVYLQRPGDAQHVGACAAVQDLELWGWKHDDFTVLAGLAPKCVRLVRGRQTSLVGLNLRRLRHLWLQDCRRLPNLSGLRVPSLRMDACNRFDLDSLGAVEGLIFLGIERHKRIESFEFVTACRGLRSLAVGTYSLRTRDFSPIIQSPTLELLYCGWLKRAEVEAISKANPRLFVCNADCAMLGGLPRQESHARLQEAFDKKYG